MLKRMTALTLSLGLLVGLGAFATSPASAQEASYGRFTDTLPQYVTGLTPFAVVFTPRDPAYLLGDGVDPAAAIPCSMTFQGQTDVEAPWDFTYNPNYWLPAPGGGWTSGSDEVEVTYCDGATDSEYIRASEAFTAGPQFVDSGKKIVKLSVSSNVDDEDVNVTLRKGSKVLAAKTIGQYAINTLEFSTKNFKKTTTLSLEFVSTSGITQVFPLTVTHKWASLWQNEVDSNAGINSASGGSFEPCSTVYWKHKTSQKPRGVSVAKFNSDITKSLALLSKQTGVKFVKASATTPAGAPVVVYSWGDARGAAGFGGPTGTGGGVEFSNSSWWPRDSNSGFGKMGRNWLIVHETMHVMGFGHSTDRSDQMYPSHTSQAGFGKGDLAGFRTLYPKATCGR